MGKILVTGASGVVGRHTLLHLLKHKSANQLVGLVRDPSKAEDLTAKGIELRQGDYLDPEALDRAFVGIDKLMLTATHAFTDRNTAHSNAIKAAVKAGVNHLVSMPIMRKPNSAFTMKEITEEDIFTKKKILASGLAYTFAEHPPFLDNIHFYIGQRAHETGVLVPTGDGKFTAATRDDLGAAHAAILAGIGHEGKTYRLTGNPAISFAEIATTLSEVTGKKVPYRAVSEEEYTQIKAAEGWPAFVVDFAKGWVHGMNTNEWAEETNDLETLIGHKPTSPTDFFRKHYITA
ncbi:NAD(P)H-binding protein [Acidobacterium sp. S8]|uniref:NAD(P)H-binding protein n=1 Tax=Acidobacterium sp. S8 TaxID=1641854 RepID=UPI00131E2BA5|nr:NAD(P)H-binding protein [Acidobacterium sp. S8]